MLVGDAEHAAGADGRVIDRPDRAAATKSIRIIGIEQIDQQADDVARRADWPAPSLADSAKR